MIYSLKLSTACYLYPSRSFQSLLLERTARLIRSRRVNRFSTLLYVTDYPVLVYDESSTASDESFFVEDTIRSDHLTLYVGEERECDSYVLLESSVGGVTVNRNAQNLRVILFEVGNISLIRLQFLRSTARKGKHVES